MWFLLSIALALALVFTSTGYSSTNNFGVASHAIDEFGSGIHVPIHRTRKTRSKHNQTWRRDLNISYSNNTSSGSSGNSEQVALSDFMDITYSTRINIGGTDLDVDIDTGSSDFWVLDNSCGSPECLGMKGGYSKSGSNTSSSAGFHSSSYLVSLFYGDSLTGTYAFGVIGTDTVQISSSSNNADGDTRKLPVLKKQLFAAINDTNTSVLETGCIGIIGLGFPINSALFLEVFENNHPELIDNNNRKNTRSPPDNRLTRSWNQDQASTPYFNRRTFPDLSKYTGGPSSTSSSNSSTAKDNMRRDQQMWLSSPWTPLLLSAFNVSGPPIWRLVTNAIPEQQKQQRQQQSTTLKPMFSVSLQRETNAGDGDYRIIDYDKGNPGILTIGGLPPGIKEEDLAWSEVRRYGVEDGGLRGGPGAEDEVYPITWEIPIDDVFFDGRKLPRSGMVDPEIGVTGLIDTGNSLIRGPPDVIQYMKNLIRQENDKLSTASTLTANSSTSTSCSIPHTLAFQIGGKMFPVDPKDLLWVDENDEHNGEEDGGGKQREYAEDRKRCYLNIAPTDVPVRGGTETGGGYLYSWSLVVSAFLVPTFHNTRITNTNIHIPNLSVLASFYYGHTIHPSWDPPRIGLMSTVDQVVVGSSTTQDRNRDGDGDQGGEGNKEREGAIPGVIQRPELPSQIPAVLDTISS
ncbi:aspartic peptidase domain-containing protein [Lentinula aciculospora]|uniref:Aspartic peptidase domain-containing protein n=1 Tax=Lentinula aciculospora TaxID=153920 RepID=A0A9W9AQ35_9AGAR|nr:aspartic peptidase domain-containing protein [Lentinula aciculospora]